MNIKLNPILKSLVGKKIYDYGLVVKSKQFIANNKYCILPNPLVLSYALAIISAGNAKKIFLAGFDGYNYNDPRRKESEEIFSLYKANNSIPIYSITPTTYDLESYSVYSQRN